MKIAVFENEYPSVSGAFEAANLVSFDNELKITDFPSSQAAHPLSDIIKYDVIFIDLDLSSRSELDGYSLIHELQKLDDKINKKIIILTGNNKIIESLRQRRISGADIQILVKPADYEDITRSINNVIHS